jgi:glycosyltransferase involved in cell wall biosynthesis
MPPNLLQSTVSPCREFWLARRLRSSREPGKLAVAICVHAYHPHIGGSELHARLIAEGLSARGHDVFVITPRRWNEPLSVDGIPVGVRRSFVVNADILFTYSVSAETLAIVRHAAAVRHRQALKWLHHPCAVSGTASRELLRWCDGVLAMNPKDVTLALRAGVPQNRVFRVPPSSHPSKIGSSTDESFRARYGVAGDYILWVGAWLPAKGVSSLERRFLALHARQPDLQLKLVMFGGYGQNRANTEMPAPHPDIVTVTGDTEHLPAALSQCVFLAFNSPAHPVGYDANPLVLLEGFMNGKTFVAQEGTPFLAEIEHLGIVVGTDEEWLRAAEQLLFDRERRRTLEARCRAAYEQTYNPRNMIEGFEQAILQLVTS